MIPFNYVIVQVWASFILSSLSPIQTFKPLFPITNLEESFESAAEFEMARNYGFLVCIFVMVIDAVAGLLGIEAEKAQNRVVLESLSISVGECSRKPRDDAFSRGLAASILLGLAHIIAKVLGGKCICIRNKQNSQKLSANQLLGLLFMILSWITLAIGFSVLMAATMDNSKWKNSCEISSHGLFLGGGIVCFFHGLCTVAYYVSATAAYREEQRDSKPSPSEPQRV